MYEQAALRDPEIKDLCDTIVASQRSEIRQIGPKLEEVRWRFVID
jgi:uncharacterized protein (DUF305 family)